jgi:membrane-bound serine protease (ClpP class)
VLDTVAEVIDDDGQVAREATTTRFFKLGTFEQLLHTSASAALAYLLLAFGLALLVFEFYTAGIGIAGSVGALCALLGGYGMAELPVRPFALVLLLVAVFAFAIDVQVGIPRAWTVIGVVLFIIASFALYGDVQGQALRLSWLSLIAGVASMTLAFVVGMPSMVRTRFATPTIGREWLVGLEGVAASDVSPEGEVMVRDAKWRARTNRATPIKAGERLRVAAIDGVTLEVEPLEGAARDYREMRKPRQ